MATKTYNQKHFTFIVNGQTCTIYCNTTHTRTGFCHHAYFCGLGRELEHTRKSYYNRTWECYDYESVMRAAVAKLPKSIQPAFYLELDNIGRRESERCERLFAAFTRNFNALSSDQKQFVREHTPHLETAEQAQTVSAGMVLMAMMQ